ncbi:hypothetical protein CISG_10334 [Coccidioides immitis RMSCC 3703]|uniref:Restriction of telomere capping protein 4 C-terminal domain-containing protein n=1 Tax=Coccidioides immitis RMSCC 3703 TaxID=454286 RepID=A0A0J8QQY1_COCIT|nr:hypothetical protein CISG_10334 [Coccidioides immitis RMSCC 3703]
MNPQTVARCQPPNDPPGNAPETTEKHCNCWGWRGQPLMTGYYRLCGFNILLEHIMREFGPEVQHIAAAQLPRPYNGMVYAQEELVPILLLMLMQENLMIGKEKAFQVLEESTEIGRLMDGKTISMQ